MKIIGQTKFEKFQSQDEKIVLGLGLFDGVHCGHQEILKKVIEEAEKRDGISGLFTFPNPPEEIVAPKRVPNLLTTSTAKVSLCCHFGIQMVFIPDFSQELSKLSPMGFIQKILSEKIQVDAVVAGFNYKFGAGKKGDINTLKEAGQEFGFEVFTIDPFLYHEVRISSTRIRNSLASGSLELVSEMLGRPHHIEGKVIPGLGVAADMVVPTANLKLPHRANIPFGVYIVRVQRFSDNIPCWEGPVYHGIMNYGIRPTMVESSTEPVAEVHLLDYKGDLYGNKLGVAVLEFVRDEMKFPNKEALETQIKEDLEYTNQVIKNLNLPNNLFGF